MTFKLGNIDINRLYLGSTEIKRVYLGSVLVYDKTGGGGPVWSPADLTGLAAWWDVSDATTLTLNGSNVSQMTDKSGNGNHMTQATASLQPILSGSELQSAGTRYMDAPDALPTDIGVIWAIGRRNDTLYSGLLGSSSTAYGNLSFVYAGNGVDYSGWVSSSRINAGLLGSLTNQPSLHILIGSGVTGLLHRRDGGASETSNASATVSNRSGPHSLFAYGGSVTDASFYEGGVIDGEVTLSDIEKLEGYLAHKWGLDANLPAAHPYKSAPP